GRRYDCWLLRPHRADERRTGQQPQPESSLHIEVPSLFSFAWNSVSSRQSLLNNQARHRDGEAGSEQFEYLAKFDRTVFPLEVRPAGFSTGNFGRQNLSLQQDRIPGARPRPPFAGKVSIACTIPIWNSSCWAALGPIVPGVATTTIVLAAAVVRQAPAIRIARDTAEKPGIALARSCGA